MELKDIIKIFRRWWWLMVLLGLVGGSAAYILTPKPIPLYQASTTVLLSQGTDTLPDVDEITRGQRLADTYGQLMRSRPLLDEVISNLGLDYNANALSSAVAVSTLQGTNILTVSVTDTDPIRAADIANEIVSAFILENAEQENSRYAASRQSLEQELAALQLELETTQLELYYVDNDVEQLSADLQELDIRENQIGLTEAEQNLQGQIEQQLGELLIQQSQLKLQLNQQNTRYSTLLTSYEEVRLLEAQSFDILTVIEPALPGNRVSAAPRKTLNGLQGAVVGTILGFGIAFLINYLQSAVVRSSEDIEKQTGLPTLAVISIISGEDPTDKLITYKQPRSPVSEAYRVLRTNLDFASGERPVHSLVVTSTSPVEGKTTTASNLAVSLAQSGKRVLLVDTDLRRPTVHKLFQKSNTRGVTTALLEQADFKLAEHILPTGIDNLYLMPSGPLPPNPADLIGSQRMVQLMHELSQHADFVVYDSPPVLAVADASLLARLTDAALLVTMAESTRLDALRKASEQLLQGGARVLGVLINRAPSSGSGYGYYYYYQYY